MEHLNQRRYGDALEGYRLLTKVHPGTPDYWFKCGFILCQQYAPGTKGSTAAPVPPETLEQALAYLDRALELDHDHFWAWYWSGVGHGNLGAATKDKGMVEEGLRRLERALHIRPDESTIGKSKSRLEKVLAAL